MIILEVTLLILLFCLFAKIAWANEVKTGDWAKYKVMKSDDTPPRITHIEMSILCSEVVDEKRYLWWQLTAFENERIRYTIKLLVENLNFLSSGNSELNADRYLFHETGKQPLEYMNIHTGKALLPDIHFVANFLPHVEHPDEGGAASADEEFPIFQRGHYLGHPIQLVEKGHKPVDRIPTAKKLFLDPELTIGTGRNFHDEDGERLYYPGQSRIIRDNPEYTYVKFVEEDYHELIHEVGMNLFTISSDQRQYVLDEPVFFVSNIDDANIPELLYRSNYKGLVQFMDEPVYLAMFASRSGSRSNRAKPDDFVLRSHQDLTETKTPVEAADKVVSQIRERFLVDGSYGSRRLNAILKQKGYDFGDLEIVQDNFPVWETAASGAWYEFKAGLPGYVFEGRYQPKTFSKRIKETFDVDFPDTTDACIAFHFAWYRGAARHFGGSWGVAIYGQMDLDVAPLIFPLEYEQGAEYLWFWTSDHGHNVPYAEQKEHTKRFREYQKEHPRIYPSWPLIEQAEVAIALPYGYQLDDYVMRWQCLWNNPKHLGLDMKNSSGVTYREVLKVALLEICTQLQHGNLFDLVYWGDSEIAGYKKVRMIMENAKACEG